MAAVAVDTVAVVTGNTPVNGLKANRLRALMLAADFFLRQETMATVVCFRRAWWLRRSE